MGRKNIKSLLRKEASLIVIPDVKDNILKNLDVSEVKSISFAPMKKAFKIWYASFACCILLAIACISVAISFGLPKEQYKEKEIKDLDKIQSVYAYQAALLTTLLNNPESVNLSNIEVNDALSNSIGFVDFILNRDKTSSTLYSCSNADYDYYLSTKLADKEVCKFYYKEQSIIKEIDEKVTILKGYIEIKNSTFDVFGEALLDASGKYVMNLMLGYEDSKVCISSNENQTSSYEYRVYNKDSICKTVSLEFKDNQIFMNVAFQNEYFKFQIHGNNNQYIGNYHTENSSGSLMVEIEKDKYNFNVDDDKSTAERYILP